MSQSVTGYLHLNDKQAWNEKICRHSNKKTGMLRAIHGR
jgi:hypothetical protein